MQKLKLITQANVPLEVYSQDQVDLRFGHSSLSETEGKLFVTTLHPLTTLLLTPQTTQMCQMLVSTKTYAGCPHLAIQLAARRDTALSPLQRAQ